MSYQVEFKGYFKYPDLQCLKNALKVIDDEDAEPDDEELNPFFIRDFKVEEQGFILRIDYDNHISSTAWFGGVRVICKMSTHATAGKVVGSYEGEEMEWIGAGYGWD